MTSELFDEVIASAEDALKTAKYRNAEEVAALFPRWKIPLFYGELCTVDEGTLIASGIWLAVLDTEDDTWMWVLVRGSVGKPTDACKAEEYYTAVGKTYPGRLVWTSNEYLEMTSFEGGLQ